MLNEQQIPVGRPLLAVPAFRRFWLGWTSTGLAIQIYAVALVWLVLETTGSGLSLGGVLTAAATPRAILMLLGGVLIDRTSPRSVLLIAGSMSALLLALLAVLTALDWLQFLGLLLIATVQGMMDAFFYPAAMAQLTRMVDVDRLTQANALFQTSDSVANILGPALGGFLVGLIGLTATLGFNSALFVSGVLLIFTLQAYSRTDIAAQPTQSLRAALRDGLRYAWERPAVRTSLLMIAMLNFAAIGPTLVGGALLVSRRFGGDATMYGWFLAGYGVGALVGGLLAGKLPPLNNPNRLTAWLILGIGAGMAATAIAPTFLIAFLLQAAMGVALGVLSVVAISWLQAQTSQEMQGRMASLLVFSAVALDPFSNGLAGMISEYSLNALFVGSGALLALVGGFGLWKDSSQPL